MRVLIPNPLRSYTAEAAAVSASGATLGELTLDLDRRFPGMRFRVIDEQGQVRPHIKFFVNGLQRRDLNTGLQEADEVMIVTNTYSAADRVAPTGDQSVPAAICIRTRSEARTLDEIGQLDCPLGRQPELCEPRRGRCAHCDEAIRVVEQRRLLTA